MSLTLLDTSAIVAAVDISDSNHLEARQHLNQRADTYIVPDTVFSETITLIKRRLGSIARLVFSFDHHFDQMAGLGLRRVP